MNKMENLKREVEKLNRDKTFEFDFKIREENNLIEIYDANENYSIDWLQETNANLHEVCLEFGKEFKPCENDLIHDRLEIAVKKDFGEDAYIDWINNLIMVVAKE